MEGFLTRLRESSDNLKIEDQRKIIKLLVKEIIIGEDRIKIRHSIPLANSSQIVRPSKQSKPETKNSLLCSGRLKPFGKGCFDAFPQFIKELAW
jgi:hypothetical protein